MVTFSPYTKHADHDQSAHGNWARRRRVITLSGRDFLMQAYGDVRSGAVVVREKKTEPWQSKLGPPVAELRWRDGTITTIGVHESYRRKGVATRMLELARGMAPGLKHSEDLSEEGAAWARTVKHLGPGNHPGTGTPQAVHGGRSHVVTVDSWEDKGAVNAKRPYKIIEGYSGSGVHSSPERALPAIVESGGLDPLESSGGYFGRGIYTSFGPSGQHLQESVLPGGVKYHIEFDLDKVIYMESDDWGQFDHESMRTVVWDALLREHPDPDRVNTELGAVNFGFPSKAYPLLLEAGFDGIVWSRGSDWDYGNEWGSQVVLMDRSKFRVTDVENLPEVVRLPPSRDPRRMLTEEWKELTEEKVRQALIKSLGDTLVVMWADFAPLLEGKLPAFSPYTKHMGPGPHPSGSPQTAHAGGRTHAYVETRPDVDLPQKFAPFGHDTEYALERIKAMPIFEGWDAQLIEDEGITDIILTKEIVGQGHRYVRFSHSEWLDLGYQGGYPADTLLMQAKTIEMFVNNPKARQLWDRLPVNVAFQSHEDMRGTLNAVGLYLDKGRVAPNATIQIAYEFEGDMRSEQDMFETLIHEYGHALDYQYSYRPKVGWAEWTAPPKMSEDFAKVLPLRDPWHQVVHFVHNWWGEKRRPGDHLSQRLMDAWAYPGSKRSHTEFFAEAVQYWVTEPRILSDTARAYNRFYEKSGKDTVFFDGEKEYPVYSGSVDASVLTDYIELALSAQPVVKRFVTEVPSPPPLDPSPFIEGMSRREWEQRVGSIAKHYGPGPHPGTGTPQSEHASDRQPQLSDKLFGTKPPTPTTRLSFSIQEYSESMIRESKEQERLNNFAARDDNAQWTEKDQMLVRHAVEDFERYLPGALPDDLEFRIGRDEPATMAWVLADQPHIVWVNEQSFLESYNAFRFSRVDPPNLVAHEVYWDTVKKLGARAETHEAIQAVKQAAIFHELVHVAASSRNIGIFSQLGHRWPAKLPYYGPEWFQEQLRVGDPRLPSNYAVDSKAEFLAEALTEYWYQGDDASEISKLTYDAFRQIIEES